LKNEGGVAYNEVTYATISLPVLNLGVMNVWCM